VSSARGSCQLAARRRLGLEPFPPGLAVGTALGRLEEVLEGNVNECEPRLGEQLVRVPELTANVHPAALLVADPRANTQRPVDRDRSAVAQEHPAGDRRESVPGRKEAAGLVDQCRDEPSVHETGAALVALVEREGRLVPVGSLGLRLREVEADRIVAAAKAGGVVVRRDLQRMPPRSKCALKKFSDPDVAIADEAEISSASVAAATICAKR